MYSSEIRQKAENLRKKGFSFSFISKKLGISKGTLYPWIWDIPYTPNKQTSKFINKARVAASLAKRRIKQASFHEAYSLAKKDIGNLNSRDLFMLGVGLYMGEGSKTHDIVRIVNANPDVMKLAIRWFRSFGLRHENLKVRLFVYPDTDISKSLAFWSETLMLPRENFYKSQIDRRTGKQSAKKGQWPYGTAHLSIISCGHREFGVLFARRINAWMGEILK